MTTMTFHQNTTSATSSSLKSSSTSHPASLPAFSFPALPSAQRSSSEAMSTDSTSLSSPTPSSASSTDSSCPSPRRHRRTTHVLCTPSQSKSQSSPRQASSFRPSHAAAMRHQQNQQSLPPVPPLPSDTSLLQKPVLARPTPRSPRLQQQKPAPLVELSLPSHHKQTSIGTFLLESSSPATPVVQLSPRLQPSSALSVSDDAASTCPTLVSDHPLDSPDHSHPLHLESCDCDAIQEEEDEEDDGEFWACIGSEAREAEARKHNARLAVAEWVKACGVAHHTTPSEHKLELVDGGWVRPAY